MRCARTTIRRSAVLLFVLVAIGLSSRTARAQPERIFDIPFRSIPFRSENFTGFGFQTPAFGAQNAAPIPFQNIQFRGLYGTAEPGRRRDVRDSFTANTDFHFVGRSRPEPQSRQRRSMAETPSVRLARRDPFGPLSPNPYPAPRWASNRREEAVPTRLQIAAERRPFAPISRN